MKRLTKIVHRKKHGFSIRSLDNKREPHPMFFLSQKSSFWIASFSIFAFVMGNMVGQHGWYLFWASVLGKEEIIYTGTVSPIQLVPNYRAWNQYGGTGNDHSYRQVPRDLLVSLPTYNSTISSATYSVAYMGTYTGDSEGSGSHPGVDIRVPVGTPIVSIANGIVDQIKRGGGFGNVIIVRHPGVPDPDDPKSLTTLYSSYAHLDSIGVTVGMIVGKGEQIGTSGQTGFVSGPHLHFQIDTEDAPWHPYWPFTTEQQAAAGYTTAEAVNAGLNRSNGYMYTINPMKYVQANYDAVDQVIVVEEEADPVDRMLSSVDERRLARMKSSGQTVAYHSQSSSSASSEPVTVSSSSVSSIVPKLSPTLNIKSATEERMIARMKRERFVVRRENVASPIVYSEEVVSIDLSSGFNPTKVHSLRIRHDGSFAGRGWEKVVIELLDIEGNTIRNPILEDDLYMRTAYGEAEFRPSIVSQIDFENGEATIHMLPRGRRTVVIQARPFIEQSKPMVWSNK